MTCHATYHFQFLLYAACQVRLLFSLTQLPHGHTQASARQTSSLFVWPSGVTPTQPLRPYPVLQFLFKYPNRTSTLINNPLSPLFIITSTLFSIFPHSPMNTRKKNKTVHPAAPDMTPGQLLAAGISKHRKQKKPTKAQQIATLKHQVRG